MLSELVEIIISWKRRIPLAAATDPDEEGLGVGGRDGTGGVVRADGDIIVGESVTATVDLVGVDRLGEVVGGLDRVVGRRVNTGGLLVTTVEEEGGAVEGSAEDGKVGLVGVGSGVGERSAVASPDVVGSGLLVGDLVVGAGDLVTVGRAGSVHVESGSLEVREDLVNISRPVGVETVGETSIIVRREDTDDGTVGVSHAHATPGEAIDALLVAEIRADSVGRAGLKTLGGLGGTVVVRELHAKDETDKVDVGDVSVDGTASIDVQLDETPVDVGRGIRRVVGGGLDEAVTVGGGNHGEVEITSSEVDTSGGDGVGQVQVDGLASRDINGNAARVNSNGDSRAAGAGVDNGAVTLDEADLVVGALTNKVSVNIGTEVVDERERKRDGVGELVRGDGDGRASVSTVECGLSADDHVLDRTRTSDDGAISTRVKVDIHGGHGRGQAGKGREERESTHFDFVLKKKERI